jgi:signal transduction histidine kinase
VKSFKDRRLAHKQAIIVGVILVLMAAANGMLIHRMNGLRDAIETVTSKWLPTAVAVGNIDAYTSDLRIMQLQHALVQADSVKGRLELVMAGLIEKIQINQDDFDRLAKTEEQGELHARFNELWDEYLDLFGQITVLSRQNRYEEAVALLNGEAGKVFSELGSVLEQLVGVNAQASLDAAWQADETYQKARRWSLFALVISLVVAVAFATGMNRLITKPVGQLAEAAENIARAAERGEEDHIDIQIDVIADDEIGKLSRSFNRMTGALREARNKIETQQRKLESANVELGFKNRDLEDAMKQLRDAQQQLVMREKMASLGNLVAGVAHEINNPVGAVMSAADTSARSIEMLCKSLENSADLNELKDNKRFQTAIEILKNNAAVTVTASERIAEIVRSLRNFARLDEAEFQRADIHDGMDSTLTLLRHRLKTRIEVNKQYGDLPRIQCYPNQLNQVFMNVLSNAEQAIAGQGQITIETAREGDAVVVRIRDTGKGIARDKVGHIFDPGFTTKGVGVGTGLGLSISYNIIQKHHGRITADSDQGRGTTITITLPIEQHTESI